MNLLYRLSLLVGAWLCFAAAIKNVLPNLTWFDVILFAFFCRLGAELTARGEK